MQWGEHEQDRRSGGGLSEDELEKIAQRAADLVWENFTLQVGKSVIKLALYVCGAAVVALLGWLGIHSQIKL